MNTPTRLLAVVFFASGLASLACQVAWQRVLTIPLGVGTLSTTLIVSVYMLGLGIGSLVGSRIADRFRSPYRVYILIEIALAAAGFASVPVLETIARRTSQAPPAIAFLCSFAFLCLPTILMGITLPLLTAIFSRATGDFTGSISRLYFVNTLGASIGALITGYICVPLLGLDGCIYAAAGLDFLLALVILAAGPAGPQASEGKRGGLDPAHSTDMDSTPPFFLALIAGFLAIGYEIIWYRVIGILVKDSPYAFSTILAVYLLGVALGSMGIRRYLAHHPGFNPGSLFYDLQFLIGVAVLLSIIGYFYLSEYPPILSLTEWSFSSDMHPSLEMLNTPSIRNAYLLIDVFTWPMIFVLIPAALMGAGFPLVALIAFSRTGRAGSAVGLTYFFVICGNVLGGIVTGIILLPWIGTESTLLLFGMIGLLFGIKRKAAGEQRIYQRMRRAAAFGLMPVTLLSFPGAGELYARMHKSPFPPVETYLEEGLDAVVLTYVNGDWVRNFINGQGHGYRPGPLFYAEALEGLSLAPSPRRILVLGFGAGSITEASLMADGVHEVTTVELCASVIQNLRKASPLSEILGHKKLKLVIDDGRRFLQRSRDRYDVILMDPLRTSTAYSNNLHSKQFFALARNHLHPGGILMVGGTGGNPVIPRTLLDVFRQVRAYPDFCVASDHPLKQNDASFEVLLEPYAPEMRRQIREFRKGAVEGNALRQTVRGWKPNDDWHPRSEYYLGAGF